MFKAVDLNVLNKGGKLIFNAPISFEIKESEIWMLKGTNGIGKSSLYEAFIGLRPINTGSIYLNNILLNDKKSENRVALGLKYVPQVNALFDDISVFNNLKIFSEFLVPANERSFIIEKAIDLFKLKEFVYQTPNHLSGGQKRMVELSKIIFGKCFLILMDEPFAAIDEDKVDYISEIFNNLKNEEQISFFINDHNTKAVEKIASYCLNITQSSSKIKNLCDNI